MFIRITLTKFLGKILHPALWFLVTRNCFSAKTI